MNKQKSLKQQVRNAAAEFVGEHLRWTPKAILIDMHAAQCILTLQHIVPPVEKEFAHGDAERRALLERCYSDAFDAAKENFECTLANIVDRPVESSMLRIDPESGNGVMIVSFTGQRPA
ncbi:MAG: DUF2294 family protein [Phycisphaerae bacterium]|nr:DUF2294 family protein [Phycisphaerae bacterium]